MHSRPSVVVSLKGTPSSKLSSMLFKVVAVTIFHLPPSSVMIMVGVEAVAAFLIMRPRPSFLRNAS